MSPCIHFSETAGMTEGAFSWRNCNKLSPYACMYVVSYVQHFETAWTVALSLTASMDFFQAEYRSGVIISFSGSS